jgi:hypothetical protein
VHHSLHIPISEVVSLHNHMHIPSPRSPHWLLAYPSITGCTTPPNRNVFHSFPALVALIISAFRKGALRADAMPRFPVASRLALLITCAERADLPPLVGDRWASNHSSGGGVTSIPPRASVQGFIRPDDLKPVPATVFSFCSEVFCENFTLLPRRGLRTQDS